jgi:hypothetical protein
VDTRPASLLFYLVGCCGEWIVTAKRQPNGEWTFWAKDKQGQVLHTRTEWEIRECLGMEQPGEK